MINCPFCEPNVFLASFAKSKNFRALYNLSPVLPGHCLIVPKDHIEKFQEISDLEIAEMVIFSRKIMAVLKEAFNTESVSWTIQEGAPAGQTISHMHLHIIPRQKEDLPEPGDWYPLLEKNENKMIDSFNRIKHTPQEMQKIIHHLSSLFDSLYKK